MTEPKPAGDVRVLAPGMPNAYTPVPGVATGGQPTAADLQRLAQAGWRTVVDTRLPEEPRGLDEARAARAAGLEYVALPVGHAPPDDRTFDAFRRLLRDPARRPALVHCASGNRVGALLIPYLVLDEGRSPQDAVSVAVAVGLRSQPLAAGALDYVRRSAAAADAAVAA